MSQKNSARYVNILPQTERGSGLEARSGWIVEAGRTKVKGLPNDWIIKLDHFEI